MARALAPPPPARLAAGPGLPEDVCRQFLYRGRCRFDQCRFSHDIDRSLHPLPSAPPGAAAWRSVDWLLRGESVQANPYLREFARAPWLPEVLSAPECGSLWNVRGRSLRKELTEAFGVLGACKRALGKLGVDAAALSRPAGTPADGTPAIDLVDLCCGKGFGSLVLALSCPRARVLAVDSNRDMELGHFRRSPNLAFREIDVTSPQAGERIFEALPGDAGLASTALPAARPAAPGSAGGAAAPSAGVGAAIGAVGAEESSAALAAVRALGAAGAAGAARDAAAAGGAGGASGGGRVRVFVGVHLCGSLSCHAARLFREAPAPAALVLAPCCLDGRRAEVKRRAKRLRMDPHRYWCLSLLFEELPLAAGCRRELLVDDDVRSERNTFLVAVRAA